MKGHIRERSPGRWAIVLDKIDPTTGKRRRKWHSFKGTKRQAETECARLITEMQSGTYLEPKKTTLAAYLEHWLTDVKARVSPKTYERYCDIARKNITPLLGAIILPKLKAVKISAAYAEALASGRLDGKGGLAPRTVHHMHRILKQALSQAVKWDMIAQNPCDRVEPPRVERATMNTYSMDQTIDVLATVRPTRLFIPTVLAVLNGLRRGEIAALRWRNVDLDRSQLAVVESAEQTRAGIRYKQPKNKRGRTVALSATVVSELRAHRARQAEELLRVGVALSGDTFVVAQPDGSPLQPDSLTQHWVRLLGGSGLPRFRFHDLRHAHATHLLASGVHPKVASERLGHSTIAITLDLYSHVMPGMQADAAARVDDAMQVALDKRAAKTGR